MSQNEVKISLVQMKMAKNVSSNLKKAVSMIHEAASGGADIVCLPELFSTQYFPQYDLSDCTLRDNIPHDTIPGKICSILSSAALDNNIILIGGSIFEKYVDHFFNTSVTFNPVGKQIGKYRKIHIPHDEKFYEQSYFEKGNTGFNVMKTSKGNIGTLICYDQWFPEAARCNALLGADMIFYPTAIGTAEGIEEAEGSWQDAWENVMRGHAIANGVIVAACNRVGVEDSMTFWGGSFIIDAFGRTLVRASSEEEIVSASVDLDHGHNIRDGWRFFYNRRPECYDLICKRNQMTEDPKSCNFHMPAEWEEHEATWLSWPKNPLTFPEDIIESVERTYSLMVEALSPGETVKILVDNAEMEERARSIIEKTNADMSNVKFFQIESSDVWIRDYGPTFIVNNEGKKAAIKWDFNAWGAKYDDLMYDNITGENVVQTTGVKVFRPCIVLEGGSIDVNGKGVVLTTEQCLLNPNRNPHLKKEDIEQYLCRYLGVDQVVWLKSGIDGDDTDGHVDDFARFVNDHTVLCSYAEGDSPDSQVLKTNFEILKSQKVFDVVALPMPVPIPLDEEERNLPASYANFYIGNNAVLVPAFDDPADSIAVEIIGKYFPNRKITSIPAKDVVYGYGGFHCITQQEPKNRE